MNQLHFGVKQLKIERSVDVLYSFVWNHVKYTNMEGLQQRVTYDFWYPVL